MPHVWEKLGFFGGHTVLDFVNTVDDEDKNRSKDAIPDWETFLKWGSEIQLISAEETLFLRSIASTETCQSELKLIREFREHLWSCLSKQIANVEVDAPLLKHLQRDVVWALKKAPLSSSDQTIGWPISVDSSGLKTMRLRLVFSFLDFVLTQPQNRIRECGRCTGLFIDTGRGRERRWCRMSTCGNRAKIEAFRNRSS